MLRRKSSLVTILILDLEKVVYTHIVWYSCCIYSWASMLTILGWGYVRRLKPKFWRPPLRASHCTWPWSLVLKFHNPGHAGWEPHGSQVQQGDHQRNRSQELWLHPITSFPVILLITKAVYEPFSTIYMWIDLFILVFPCLYSLSPRSVLRALRKIISSWEEWVSRLSWDLFERLAVSVRTCAP